MEIKTQLKPAIRKQTQTTHRQNEQHAQSPNWRTVHNRQEAARESKESYLWVGFHPLKQNLSYPKLHTTTTTKTTTHYGLRKAKVQPNIMG